MSRGLDSNTLAAAQADVIVPVLLVKLEIDTGDVRLHDGLGDITYNGEIYSGAGALGFVGALEEDSDLTRNPMEIGLRGIPNDIIALLNDEKYQGRLCTLYQGYLDPDSMTLAGEPYAIVMRMDFHNVNIGKESQIRLKIEDEFTILDKAINRRYNNADQQSEYPDDKLFEHAEEAVSRPLYWGQPTPV